MSAFRRIVAVSLTVPIAAGQGPAALAQSDAPVPPMRSSIDQNEVDLLSGKVIFTTTDLSIGPADERGLTYSRQWVERGWRPTLLPVLSGSSSNPVVTFNGKSTSFTAGLAWDSDAKDGSQFTAAPGTATYTSSDGVTIQFVTQDGYTYPDYVLSWGHPTSVTFPNGVKWTFTYRAATYSVSYTDPECIKNCPVITEYYEWKRLSSIQSSAGYQLKLSYASDSLTGEEDVGTWIRLNRVTGINNAVEACNPAADSCALTQPWPHVDYGYDTPWGDVGTMTDSAGQTWTFNYQSTRELTSIRRPTASSAAVTYGYTAYNGVGKVTSVTRGGSSWTYSYGNGTTTVTDPASNTRVVTFDPSTSLVSSDQDESGNTTSFAYCQSTDTNCPVGRLKTATFPEGDAVGYEYDIRGNVTKMTRSPKPGSGLTAIVSSASFPSSCGNPKTCNKPISTTDPRGAVSDYTYDSAHGGVLTATSPAATSGGARPETRFSYTATTNSVSGDAPYLLTGVSTCRTTASCVGTADETKTTISYSASNLLATSRTIGAGDGSLAATVALGYDDIGNVTSVDGPLPGAADTNRFAYDALRRTVTQVSADPDGSGPKPNRAVRYSYDSQSRLGSVANGTSDSTGTSFTAIQTVTAAYDSADRKSMETLSASGTPYQLTQYSYDALGRLDCTALRMNSATWGGLPDACTLATTGSAGPDRITRNSYDAVGRVTKVQSAYGTADQSDEATSTYSANGKVATATDALGNRTTYDYDGFDRLLKMRYPVATAGAGASSTTDYEQLGYDTASNVISRRLRDGTMLYYGYDNLNRLTSKDRPNAVWWETDHSYSYDLLGRPTAATDSNAHSISFGYDALGRKTSEASNWYGTMTSGYDVAGRRTAQYWPDGFFVLYDYLVTGEMTAVRENGATSGVGVLASYSYDDLGRRTGITRGNGTSTSYGYDAVSRLASLGQDLAGSGQDVTSSFTHNPANQIASRTISNDTYAWNGHYNVDRGYGINGLNQATSAGATGIGYDGRGNLTSSGSSAYGYTTDNQLATSPGSWYAYDPLGRLFHETGVNGSFLYDGTEIMLERDQPTSAIRRRYVYGPGTDEPLVWYEGSGTSDRRWLHADERGSVVAVTDGSGAAIAINRYDEYGIPASGNIGRFQYTGQAWLPELGMYYYKARIYSPTLGRFMQTDPIGYGDGMNMYGYVGGDPVNRSDPSGLLASTPPKPCSGGGWDILVCGIERLGGSANGKASNSFGHGCEVSDGCTSISPEAWERMLANTVIVMPQSESQNNQEISSDEIVVRGIGSSRMITYDPKGIPRWKQICIALMLWCGDTTEGAPTENPESPTERPAPKQPQRPVPQATPSPRATPTPKLPRIPGLPLLLVPTWLLDPCRPDNPTRPRDCGNIIASVTGVRRIIKELTQIKTKS